MFRGKPAAKGDKNKKSRVPDELREKIYEIHSEGKSVAYILKFLKNNYDLECSQKTVYRIIKEHNSMRQEIVKEVYTKSIEEGCARDMFILNDKIEKFNQLVDEAIELERPIEATKVGETLLKFLDRRMKMSGIDNPDVGSQDNVMLTSLLEKLGK